MTAPHDHHCDISGLNASFLLACEACKARFLEARDRRVPDSYGPHLAKLRAASAASPHNKASAAHEQLARFAADLARTRLAAFDAEYRRIAEARTAEEHGPRLTAAELADYAAPDPYRIALDKMKEGQRQSPSTRGSRNSQRSPQRSTFRGHRRNNKSRSLLRRRALWGASGKPRISPPRQRDRGSRHPVPSSGARQ